MDGGFEFCVFFWREYFVVVCCIFYKFCILLKYGGWGCGGMWKWWRKFVFIELRIVMFSGWYDYWKWMENYWIFIIL